MTEIDTSKPHPARMYDWYLGGKDNYPVDEAMGKQMLALDPRVPVMARVNRAFMHRSTRWLAQQGVRQFLDIGTGIPTEPNLHQVAQRIAPDARVVYCDNDPIVLAHAAALLRGTEEGATEYLQADVRDPGAIVEGARKVLDFSRPVALSLIALLHFVSDEDGAHELVRRLLSELPSGSYLVLTHATADFTPEESKAATEKLKAAGVTLTLRAREGFTRFFEGLELVPPGVQVPHQWHPDLGEPVPGQDDGVIPGYGAVGRKP
ncbi:SAM-dependent methyltransferase [Streptomyces ferrugineus]|uniref:SAM-dependent methyltransferase n=1 Tax=Streptomyces ferrugineus TaxID=1413221 RepID=A0A7M2SS52_9ACTN|nr:SAM-dependent methyltransferase [Streptomyces ferrugineus]QOV39064.1 SAM-dependent methyltransferase [Streptomyces ferrugineus]